MDDSSFESLFPFEMFLTPNNWSVRMANTVLRRHSRQNARWNYEQGLQLKALVAIGEATYDPQYEDFVRDWVDQFVGEDGDIRTYRIEEYSLDQINPGKLLFHRYRETHEARYARALHTLRTQLSQQPRTPSGGFWHKQIYPDQMWLDGIYMAQPFYAEYASVFGEPAVFDDVAHQILLIEAHTRHPQSGLLYHAWNETRREKWANPETGCSPHFWGRAMGWFAMALVDVLDHFPADHAQSPAILAVLQRLAQAVVRVQDPVTGLWYQVLDQPGRPGNYLEASASAMFVYAFARAMRKGWLPSDYLAAAQRGYRGLLENRVKVDAQGLLILDGTCRSTGLGGVPYRDGSFEYYINEPVVADDPKGVGVFILAALEMEESSTFE
ncbi:MAG: glycoside hydrolase family 88/105 protein [Chloroflexota bacterium]